MIFDNDLLDKLLEKAQSSPIRRKNYDLRDSENDLSQRMFNALEMGTEVPIHRHQDTSETVVILRGAIDEIYYDEEGKETRRYHLNPKEGNYGLQIPAGQWHNLEVIEPSVIIEMKNGPFSPRKEEDVMNI